MGRFTSSHFRAGQLPLLVIVAVLASAQTPPAGDAKVLFVSETVARQMVKVKVDPEYPATARQFHMAGEVVAQITVGPDGKIETLNEVTGNQILQSSVKMALRRWVFSPYLTDGKPIRFRTIMTFAFRIRA